MLVLGDGEYRMADLVARTGFSERQIRFYVTEGLVDGAGGKRGPHATYGQATLDRLMLIRSLKEIRVKPANRPLTLAEIRQTIASLGEEGASLVRSNPGYLTILDTDAVAPQVPSGICADVVTGYANAMQRQSPAQSEYEFLEERNLPLLLTDLLATLDELAGPRAAAGARDDRTWRRLALDDLEIQVRVPADPGQSRQLGRHAAALRAMLKNGDDEV